MAPNLLDVLLVIALVALEAWRRWLRRTSDAPRWIRYVTIVGVLGIVVRLVAWRHGTWTVESAGPEARLGELEAVVDRVTPFVIAGNVVALAGLAGAAITLFAATWRYRWSRRRHAPPTVGPYR